MTTATSIVRLLAAAGLLALLTGCGRAEDESAMQPADQAPAGQTPTAGETPMQDQTAATNEPPPADQTLRAAGYEIAAWDGSDTGAGRLEISRDGEVVYALTGERFVLGGPGPSAARVGLGEDITGDGVPNLVVEFWTGGTVCCVDYLIYDLGRSEPELLGRVAASTGGRFEDFDSDGVPEIRVRDGAFLGWNATIEESPAPPVVLRWDGLWYAPAPELMRDPAPTHVQLTSWRRLVESGAEWEAEGPFAPPAQLWGVALDLMYTGHPRLGMAFLDSAWRDDVPGREAFVASFMNRLAESEHWPVVSRAFTAR